MKGYYIHFDQRRLIGVSKKIDMQLRSFAKSFDIEEIDIVPKSRSLFARILWALPFSSINRDYSHYLSLIEDPDFIYIRRSIADRKYMSFISLIRKKYPKCRIIVELYTYPYDRDEFLRKNTWIMYGKERFYRRLYKKYIDRFVVYTDDEHVFGVPTLKTMNGIDFSLYDIKKCENKTDEIRLISVAFLQKQHAYERLIEGIHEYYKNGGTREIKYYIVGTGPEADKYVSLVSKYDLKDRVIFTGQKTGKDLDEIYNICDIGAVSFGTYKTDIKVNSALKTREYMAKGLPMVFSGRVDVLDEQFPYKYTVADDSSPVKIDGIIELYDRIKDNKESTAKWIREFGEKRVSMDSTMDVVYSYIRSGE